MYIKLAFSIIFLLLFNPNAFAESSYFKKCVISNAVSGDYIINIDRKVIEVTLEATDGTVQNFTDKIVKNLSSQGVKFHFNSTFPIL